MPDNVKIPLDKAVVPLTLKPGEEIVIKGVLYSTEDGSRIDARATSWPGSAPGGVSQAYELRSHSAPTLQRREVLLQRRQGKEWIDLGPDPALAAKILGRIERRLRQFD